MLYFLQKEPERALNKTVKGQLKLQWEPYNVNDAESEIVAKEPGDFE